MAKGRTHRGGFFTAAALVLVSAWSSAHASSAPVEFYFYLNADQDILGSRPDGEIDNQAEILYDELRALAPVENFGIHVYLDRGTSLRGGDPIDSETYDACAGKPTEIEILGETDSIDPKHVTALTGKKCYPDSKRFFVLWSHGDGFRIQADFDYNPGDRGFHVARLLAAIPDGFAEAILFDSCSMASLEIASLVESKAKWMVASQFELPNVGIQYGGLPAALAKSRETRALLASLRADSERKFSQVGLPAPLVLLELTKLPAVRTAFAHAWELTAAKSKEDYPAFRASVVRRRDGDLAFLFGRFAPEAKKVLAAALESGRGSLHFALSRSPDRDDDLEAVAISAPHVFRTWSENFPNWAAYARFRSSTPSPKGVPL